MDLTVLVDNNCKTNYFLLGEPGFSVLLENNYHKVLFDCGYSDAFIKNAYKLGLDLADVNEIILSHGHKDHTGGLLRLESLYRKMLMAGISLNLKTIITHPDTFEPKLSDKAENIRENLVGLPRNFCFWEKFRSILILIINTKMKQL